MTYVILLLSILPLFLEFLSGSYWLTNILLVTDRPLLHTSLLNALLHYNIDRLASCAQKRDESCMFEAKMLTLNFQDVRFNCCVMFILLLI